MSLSGNPFGDIQDFVWFIKVSDKEDRTIWSSQSIPGTTRQFAIPENVVNGADDYKYEGCPKLLAKQSPAARYKSTNVFATNYEWRGAVVSRFNYLSDVIGFRKILMNTNIMARHDLRGIAPWEIFRAA